MKPLLVKITLKDGRIVAFQATADEAKTTIRNAPTDGFCDASGRYHPGDTIETMEIENAESARHDGPLFSVGG